MTGVRETQDLVKELRKPRRLSGKINLAGLEACTLSGHAANLVAFRRYSDGHRDAIDRIGLEFLDEMKARAGSLDQNGMRTIIERELDELLLQPRKLKPPSPDMQKKVVSLDDRPRRTH